jgi:hypothetical protein
MIHTPLNTMKHDEFLHGVLAALDIVLLHDQPVVAAEIIRSVGPKELMAHAKREEYAFLPQLRAVYRMERIKA